MRKGRRRRRASLRGWWRVLPFVAAAGATFVVFTWLHSQVLRNEYRSIELTAEIGRVKDRLAELRGERYRLGRMERMNEKAPKQELIEPEPGQIQIVRAAAEDMKIFEMPARPRAVTAPATRSVVMILGTLAADRPSRVPEAAMAQTSPPADSASPEKL